MLACYAHAFQTLQQKRKASRSAWYSSGYCTASRDQNCPNRWETICRRACVSGKAGSPTATRQVLHRACRCPKPKRRSEVCFSTEISGMAVMAVWRFVLPQWWRGHDTYWRKHIHFSVCLSYDRDMA